MCAATIHVRGFRKKYKWVCRVVAEKEAGEKKRNHTQCDENGGKRNISHTIVSILRILRGGRGYGDGEEVYRLREVHSYNEKCILLDMKPRIQEIFAQLKDFGNPSNLTLVERLYDIAQTTEDDIERDQAIDLMLFCEANENGSLGMNSLNAIALRFNN